MTLADVYHYATQHYRHHRRRGLPGLAGRPCRHSAAQRRAAPQTRLLAEADHDESSQQWEAADLRRAAWADGRRAAEPDGRRTAEGEVRATSWVDCRAPRRGIGCAVASVETRTQYGNLALCPGQDIACMEARRVAGVSASVLDALVRALQLDDAERAHLPGHRPGPFRRGSLVVTAELFNDRDAWRRRSPSARSRWLPRRRAA